MPLSHGVRLGPYEILDAIGAGGMGEVYRARDTRLERTVAIKILPAHLSGDPLQKQRFEREAKTRVVNKLERHEMAWLRICTGSLFEWASPIEEPRLQSRVHEVIDYRGIQDALGAPTRLLIGQRNSESRIPVVKRISGGGEPDPDGVSDQGPTTAFRGEKETLAGISSSGSKGTGRRGQSGALLTSILDWSLLEHVGFSAIFSTGSMLDVGL
jgi:serine/threonine protein kinase